MIEVCHHPQQIEYPVHGARNDKFHLKLGAVFDGICRNQIAFRIERPFLICHQRVAYQQPALYINVDGSAVAAGEVSDRQIVILVREDFKLIAEPAVVLRLSDVISVPGSDRGVLTFDSMLQLVLVVAYRQTVDGILLHTLTLLALQNMLLQLY
ncbi:hypothetical protein D3C75_825270 [compost metagenome]